MSNEFDSDIIESLTPDDLELLLRRKRFEMRKKEILAKYPIKQLPYPDGRYWVRISGKQYFRKSQVKLEKLILELTDDKKITIASIFDEYLEERKLRVAATTWSVDTKYYHMYLEESKLAYKPINKITLDDGYEFFDYVKNKKGDLKEKYWCNVKSFLNAIMRYCIQRHYIDVNPFEHLIVHGSNFAPKTEYEDKDTVFSEEERKKVCRLAELDAEYTGSAIPLGIIILFNTGLRDGEIIASKWCDVVNVNGQPHLYIRRIQVGNVNDDGFVRGRVTAERCKTKKSKRKVPLNSKCVEVLEKVKRYNEENGYPTDDDDYIFYRMFKGEICECTERCFAGRLKKYCIQSGMQVLKSPHDVRRTALTNLWLNGVPIKIIQMIAGHTTQKQTEEYLRITETDIINKNYMETLVKNNSDESEKKPKIGQKSANVKGFGVQSNVLQFPRRA